MATSVASPPSATAEALRGDEHPRVDVHPPYARTLAQDVIDLALLCGLELDFWQQQALATMCAVREAGKWACFEYLECVARQNGKGSILEARVLAGLFLFDERLILWSAHEYKTAMEAFRRVGELLRRWGRSVGQNLILIDDGAGHTITIKVTNTNGEESFERLDTGQRLKFIARSKGSGRGFSGDLIIIDEAMFYTALQHAALLFALSARPNPQIIYTSSPPLDGDSGDQLFDIRTRAEDMLASPEVAAADALGCRIWGPEGDLDHLDKLDLDDPRNVTMANPALGIRITMETVQRERRSLKANGGKEFARERLGIWPVPKTMAGGALDPAEWAKLQDPESERDRDAGVALGVNVAPDLSYASIALYGPRTDGLGHGVLVDRRAGTGWIVPRLAELRDSLDPITVAMNRATFALLEDQLANAGFQLPEDPDDPWHGELLVMTSTDQAASCGQMIESVRDQAFRVKPHPEQPEVLNDAATKAKTRRMGDTIAWSRKEDDAEVSPLAALCEARFGYLSRVKATEVETLDGPLMA